MVVHRWSSLQGLHYRAQRPIRMFCTSHVQESRAQAASHGQPPAPADSYANGGHNYYAAGWQPPQPPRPKTAEPAAKQSGFGGLVPKQWVGRQEAPQSAAQAQPMFGNGQVGVSGSPLCLGLFQNHHVMQCRNHPACYMSSIAQIICKNFIVWVLAISGFSFHRLSLRC